MIRCALDVFSQNIKDIIISQYENNEEIRIEEYDDKRIADVYFLEIKNENDIEKYIHLKNRNHFSLIILIGKDDIQLIRKGYRLEPVDFIRIEYLNEDLGNTFFKLETLMQSRFQTYLYESKNSKAKIRLSTIYYVESFKHYIHIHTQTGEYIERKSISQFIKEMHEFGFIQIHKSYVINLDNIKIIDANVVELVSGEK